MNEQWNAARDQVERWQKEHPYDAIEVEVIDQAAGLYRLHSSYDKQSIAVTARGLVELLKWLDEHKGELTHA